MSNIKENIKSLYRADGKLNTAMLRSDKFKQSELYSDVLDHTTFLESSSSTSERIYCISNGLTTRPTCKNCSGVISYVSGEGYKQFCSPKCSKTFNGAHNKNNPMSEAQKEKLRNLAKARPPTRIGAILSQDTKDKISHALIGIPLTDQHKTSLKLAIADRKADGRYSSPVPKGTKISQEHYDKSVPSLILVNQQKSEIALRAKKEKLIKNNLELLSENDKQWTFKCNICDTIMSFHNQIFDECRRDGEVCTTCFPRTTGTSIEEKELVSFIKNLISDNVVDNDRTLLGGFELDAYIPSRNLAFEYCGLYWHSYNVSNLTSHKYHIANKTTFAYKKNTKLITIFSDEWLNKLEITKSRIRNILGISGRKIYARKCSVTTIDNKTKNAFLLENHIQASDISKIRYGAFYNDELVAVMTFKPTNQSKGGDGSVLELSRFCSKLNTNVVGIASKIFTQFIKDYSPPSIISYADLRWGSGNLYKTLGFKYVSKTLPNFYYTIDYKTRMHRSNFMKHKLKNFPNYSEEKTAEVIMIEAGYDKIYDCGSTKWIWTNPILL